jgi:RNA polymerase sigma factor (sigma-70 family)
MQLGAGHYYATSDPETFKQIAGSFDLIPNIVSAQIDIDAYLSLLALDGTLVNVGAPADPLARSFFDIASYDVIKEVDLKIEKSKIYRNLDILDEREKEVVVGRFGLDTGGEERTQREIAKDLGISRSYVSRIEKRALMKLYHEFYKAKR